MRHQERQRIEIQFDINFRGAGHFNQVSKQTKTRHVRAGGGTTCKQNFGSYAVRLHHRCQRIINPSALGVASHIGREQGAGAEAAS